MSFGIIRSDPHCRAVGSNRIGPIAFAGESVAEIIISFRVIGIDFESLSKMDNSVIQLSLFHQGVAEIVLGNVIFRGIGESLIPQGFTTSPDGSLTMATRR